MSKCEFKTSLTSLCVAGMDRRQDIFNVGAFADWQPESWISKSCSLHQGMLLLSEKNVKSHCHRRWEIMNDRPFKTKEVHFQARSKLLLGIITYWWLLKITFEQSFWKCLSFLSETETTDWQIILTNSIQVTNFQSTHFSRFFFKTSVAKFDLL